MLFFVQGLFINDVTKFWIIFNIPLSGALGLRITSVVTKSMTPKTVTIAYVILNERNSK